MTAIRAGPTTTNAASITPAPAVNGTTTNAGKTTPDAGRTTTMSKAEAILHALVCAFMIGAWVWALWAIAATLDKF